MNIFTNDDYRRIQAWLKANAIKDSDFAISEDTVPDEDILVITQNMSVVPTNYKIKIKDLLNSSLGKVTIDKIIANTVKVNGQLVVDTEKFKLDDSGNVSIEGVTDIKSGTLRLGNSVIFNDGDLTTIKGNIESTGEITDGHGNQLKDVNKAAKGWFIEKVDPATHETTVRSKYILKDYQDHQHGIPIKVYKDSSVRKVWIGSMNDEFDESTLEPIKKEVTPQNPEALCIVYMVISDKTPSDPNTEPAYTYELVHIDLHDFVREVEFTKGLQVNGDGTVQVKLSDPTNPIFHDKVENFLKFEDDGSLSVWGLTDHLIAVEQATEHANTQGDYAKEMGDYAKEQGTFAKTYGSFAKEQGDIAADRIEKFKDVVYLGDVVDNEIISIDKTIPARLAELEERVRILESKN